MELDLLKFLSSKDSVPFVGALFIGILLLWLFRPAVTTADLPLFNGTNALGLLVLNNKIRFLRHGHKLLKEGFAKSPSGFRLMTHSGEKIVLPSSYAEQLRNDGRLNARKDLQQDYLSHIPSLSPITGGSMKDDTIHKILLKITRSLGELTGPMNEEVGICLQKAWTDRTDWHEVRLAKDFLPMVVQVSSRAFLGEQLGRDPRWLEATLGYMTMGFASIYTLHLVPRFLHPLLQWVLPFCRKATDKINAVQELMQPILEERKAMQKKPNDAIAWIEEAGVNSSYDHAVAQLTLSFTSTHTTSDFLTKVLVHICENQDLIPELRKEIDTVIGESGMTKENISRLKLLDSVMKESQRVNPIALATMGRKVLKTIELPDGLILPGGSHVLVSTDIMKDPSVYPEPDRFDGYRYLRLREAPGKEKESHFTSTSAHHLGFGHGNHACPGRFLAAHEIKIILIHILSKYDLQLPAGYQPRYLPTGFFMVNDPNTRILVRRREGAAVL